MDVDRDKLQELREQMNRQNRLKRMLDDLYTQKKELETKVEELRQQKEEEQKDVDRLEDRGFTALFYSLIGKMDEKLTKEQQEAYEAAVRYESAQQELASITYNIELYEKELKELDGCKAQYDNLFEKVKNQIKAAHSDDAAHMIHLEELIAQTENTIREIDEAYDAGDKALFLADEVIKLLENAAAWGTWDMLGGGLVSTMVKHSNLDEAQRQVAELQIALRRFKTELTDVTVDADFQVKIDGFLKFADYFFDGIFADWAVQERIRDSKGRVQKVKSQILNVMEHLKEMKIQTKDEQCKLQKELEAMIVG